MPLGKRTAHQTVTLTLSRVNDFARLFRHVARERLPAVLDSAGGPPGLSRLCILAFDPFQTFVHDHPTTVVTEIDGLRRTVDGCPFDALRTELARFHMGPAWAGTPLQGGAAIGFLSYEMGRHVERLPQMAIRDIMLPDMYWAFYDSLMLVDVRTGRAAAHATNLGGRDPAWLIDRWRSLVETMGKADAAPATEADAPPMAFDQLRCNFTPDGYRRAVARTIEYIASGDIFQANLSQRFTAPRVCSASEMYLRLRRFNPAPFAAYIASDDPLDLARLGRWAVLSSSPERFLKVTDGRVATRPIKGTRPRRPGDEAFNARSRDELLASAKDAAELAMIVDLERNDLGRVCSFGTVNVTEPRTLEEYASVYHSVAQVEGRLHHGCDLVDLLKATFPGGSITGAPKVRAMEIIDELEPTCRSVYTGAIGHIGYDGRMDLNIAIRTLLVDDDRVHLQVGGGIVADSTPEGEYTETLDKARSVLAALGVTI
jgi:para-aminobenzoate synthetase component I